REVCFQPRRASRVLSDAGTPHCNGRAPDAVRSGNRSPATTCARPRDTIPRRRSCSLHGGPCILHDPGRKRPPVTGGRRAGRYNRGERSRGLALHGRGGAIMKGSEPVRGTYQHYKGGFYEVLGVADNPAGGGRFVVYESLGITEDLLGDHETRILRT